MSHYFLPENCCLQKDCKLSLFVHIYVNTWGQRCCLLCCCILVLLVVLKINVLRSDNNVQYANIEWRKAHTLSPLGVEAFWLYSTRPIKPTYQATQIDETCHIWSNCVSKEKALIHSAALWVEPIAGYSNIPFPLGGSAKTWSLNVYGMKLFQTNHVHCSHCARSTDFLHTLDTKAQQALIRQHTKSWNLR